MPNLRHSPVVTAFLCVILCAGAAQAQALGPGSKTSRFTYKDSHGATRSAPVVTKYYPKKIDHPLAKVDPRIDPTLTRAASVAQERAHAKSNSRCWHYVKEALVATGAVNSYPKTPYAKQAGDELVREYGFKKLSVRDPYSAPVGSVLVYSNRGYAGHVEIRTKNGFVSDFFSKTACSYPLIAAFVKFTR
jgi:hypothetical protein